MEVAENFTLLNYSDLSDSVYESASKSDEIHASNGNTIISLCAILWGYALYIFLCPKPNCKCLTMLSGKMVVITGEKLAINKSLRSF